MHGLFDFKTPNYPKHIKKEINNLTKLQVIWSR